MKQRLSLIVLLVFIITLLFTSCGDDAAKDVSEKVNSTNVEIKTLSSQKYTDFVTVVGSIKPYNDAMVSHEMGGIIEKIVKDKGEYVSKGDTIIILDNSVLKASMDAAKAQYELSEARFQKQKKVFDENVGSEFEFLNTKYSRDQLKAVYEQAKVAYEKSYIKAPFNGIVDSRYFEKGELVPPSVAVIRVLDPSKLKIEAGIPEHYAGDIKKGANAKIYIKELFDKPFNGKVSYVGKALDPANRTFPIEVIIDNKDGLIKPEMLAEVSIEIGVYENVVIVPEEVVTRSDSSYIAFVENNGKAELRNVDILSRTGESIVVENGLKNGDKLIVLGFQNLVDGENVSIVN